MADPAVELEAGQASVVLPAGPEVEEAHVVIDLSQDQAAIEITDAPASALPLEAVPERRGLLGAAPWELAAKRAIDVVVASLLLLVLSPVMLVTMLAIRLSSRGPVLLRQERVGQDGIPFRMYKFRSMRAGAHETRAELDGMNEVTGPVFKMRTDPRVTKVGRVIRKLSLDELPQLVNVLRGEMSLVGPRPPLPEEVARYTPYQRRRLQVQPGITCIWQVSGRSEIEFDTWVEMDLRYIEEWSVKTDLLLLLRTVPAVLSGRGAF